MTKPSNLTFTAQEELLKRTGSFYGDNFFIKCQMSTLSMYIDGVASSFLDWISFYFIGDASVFLLLILPVLFFFQASGKQRKMQKLYSNSRYYLIVFLDYCAFAITVSPIVGWIIQRPSPCVEGIHNRLMSFGFKYQCPSPNVVLASVIGMFLINTEINSFIDLISEKDKDFKMVVSHIFNKYFLKIISIVYIAFFMFADLIYGKSSFIQTQFSVFFGISLYYIVSMIPIYMQMILHLIFFIFGVILMFLYPHPMQLPSTYDEVWRLLITGFGFQVYVVFLLYRFIKSRKNISLASSFNDLQEENAPDHENKEAVFGEMEIENTDELDIKVLLMDDLKDSVFGTLIQILFGVAEEIVLTSF